MNIATIANLFGPQSLIILLAVVVLFGAKRIPELAKGMGQAIREFSKAKDGNEPEAEKLPQV
ncbi:MAG TPA: twin-arginine translocase TatA/TatE family subunit [Chthoniobacteraceae bacterium]|jgi:sec-independent protein translocase protein TatA|nr:Sec-independent protein translocase protein TatA [Chthoniobacter sp.]HEV7868747.1 twin-arginine translocase TatA/TatE family subunit [Chthoniobacteraceae bacterium]